MFSTPKRTLITVIVMVVLFCGVSLSFRNYVSAMILGLAQWIFNMFLIVGLMAAAVKWLFSLRPK